MAVPPLVRCVGAEMPAASGLNGLYEYHGNHLGRPVYRQTGASSRNFLWFAEDSTQGPMWVITPKTERLGGPGMKCIARNRSVARLPWDIAVAEIWECCDLVKDRKGALVGIFSPVPSMCFELYLPIPRLEVAVSLPQGAPCAGVYGFAGLINGRCLYRHADPAAKAVQIVWDAKQRRWLIAETDVEAGEKGAGGIRTVIARSFEREGALAALPWQNPPGTWEVSNDPLALMGGDFLLDNIFKVSIMAPDVRILGATGPLAALNGVYGQNGELNGRACYRHKLEEFSVDTGGPMSLWFSEDRGMWVFSTPELIGNSDRVCARIQSRAWWPWEAHLGSSTSPSMAGSVPASDVPVGKCVAEGLAATRVSWEIADGTGGFSIDTKLHVRLEHDQEAVFQSRGTAARYAFLGRYTCAGMLSGRPFFLQHAQPGDFHGACWFSEEDNQWIITEDWQLLDKAAVNCRSPDCAWFPWDVMASWEVPDGTGGFLKDTNLVFGASAATRTERWLQAGTHEGSELVDATGKPPPTP
eukprot:gnl/MRDRNA2_/MRDRNA2_29305_c0_seq1.p1 gnl/MRDRNA2_/MRDRNA2_29305_c0~~gnl/MRDRNA2_/MRDRNA2_29305_c0_seq1.p1  ORF type:complete len:527 (-),score=83.39 gnl/MRDRNA2_/MRDRNA2_29305_c0_seq1:109-1689(-)